MIYSPEVSPALTRSLGHHGHGSPRGDGSTPLVAGFNAYAAGETGYSPGLSVTVRGSNPPAAVIPFSSQVASRHNGSRCEPGGPAHTLRASGSPESSAEVSGAWVRRLTVRECERLQGFPDGWTQVAGVSTSARYKALGNAVAVPVVEWIARRLP